LLPRGTTSGERRAWRCAISNRDTYPNANGKSDANPNANGKSDANPNPNRDPNPNTDAFS
jgi:hypothetical protein